MPSSTIELIEQMLIFRLLSKHAVNAHNEQQTIMLSGAIGSLELFMLCDCILSPQVKKIYYFIRGSNDELSGRLMNAFRDYLLDVSSFKSPKVETLPMLLNDEPCLGWNQVTYAKLKSQVTIVQHCAWCMDMRQSVEHYEREMIRG
ncbi:hypothetical protein BDB00DRAFT_868518 [Zychaea mexicana]|uniref:uncharacterized protein n=1 Tax=Zychaea mexicana TaxID=64656 RepID=UPI0022FE6389|nr:uncharacterized protein BDB00DRAFT_868518 [Zychaea mexicana]KAI9497481.1 hypothetical protein BDB00DRAFT_868518 [Zychaea mexicana]